MCIYRTAAVDGHLFAAGKFHASGNNRHTRIDSSDLHRKLSIKMQCTIQKIFTVTDIYHRRSSQFAVSMKPGKFIVCTLNVRQCFCGRYPAVFPAAGW